MKKYLFVIIFIFLIVILILFDKYLISNYEVKDFSVSYNNIWKAYNKNSNYLYLYNDNGSTIKFISKVNDGILDKNILINFNNDFLSNNKSYKLVNSSQVKIGKKYLDSYEYLYEDDKNSSLNIIYISNKQIILINYTANLQYFDIDLMEFYNVLNTMEVK